MSADPRIAEIRAQLAAITPYPWKVDRNWHVTAEGHDWDRTLGKHYDRTADLRICHVFGPGNANSARADFAFIASAPSSMEYLLGELDALRAQLEEATKEIEGVLGERDLMIKIAVETYGAWDRDQDSRVGKWLAALSGTTGIRADLDAARSGTSGRPSLTEAEVSGGNP